MKAVLLSDRRTVTFVDDEDAHRMLGHNWHQRRHASCIYARAKIAGAWVYLHRFIMCPPSGMVVDHIDHDGLNNVRTNLRVVTQQQNMWNVSGAPGRGVGRKNGKWRARIHYDGRRLELGFYDDKADAIAAYDTAVAILRDEHAFRNGPAVAVSAIAYPPTARRVLMEARR